MSKCGYYSCYGGNPTCKHPTYGTDRTKVYKGYMYYGCDWCKYKNGGVWPSQLPKASQIGWEQDVVDRNGNVLDKEDA